MKNKISLILTFFTIVFGGGFLFPVNATAVDVLSPACNNPNAVERPKICDDNQSGASDSDNPIVGPNGIVTKAVQILTIVMGIAAVIVIIISGIKFVTSGGNSENIDKAKKGLTYAVVGLLIAIFAQAIVSFVLHKL